VQRIQELEVALAKATAAGGEGFEYRNALKKMRKSVEELQRELVRLELRVVVKELDSDLDASEEELDELFGATFGLETDVLNYISVTFLTLGVASLAWAVEWFVLGEDTSWWWRLPNSAQDLALILSPAALAGLCQVPALKPLFVDRFPYLDEYLEQIFSHNTDLYFGAAEGEEDFEDYELAFRKQQQQKVNALGPAREGEEADASSEGGSSSSGKEEKKKREGGEEGLEGEGSLPFLTYLCFDTTIIGSELIVALGFLQGLLLKSLGTIGWSSSEQFMVQMEAAENAMGSIVNTGPLNAFSSGPFAVLAVAALITSIDVQLNEVLKNEPEVLSELLYSEEAEAGLVSDTFSSLDRELKPVLRYLTQVKNRKRERDAKEKVGRLDRLQGKKNLTTMTKRPFQTRTTRAVKKSKEELLDLAKRLSKWQSKLLARRKYVFVEGLYWVYLTSEVLATHSLVPSILTAVSLETFSWYRLWKQQRKD